MRETPPEAFRCCVRDRPPFGWARSIAGLFLNQTFCAQKSAKYRDVVRGPAGQSGLLRNTYLCRCPRRHGLGAACCPFLISILPPALMDICLHHALIVSTGYSSSEAHAPLKSYDIFASTIVMLANTPQIELTWGLFRHCLEG